MMQKDPVTGTGKKSAIGRLLVRPEVQKGMYLTDGISTRDAGDYAPQQMLRPVWSNGKFHHEYELVECRQRAEDGLKY